MVEGLRFRVKDGEFSGGVKVLKVSKVSNDLSDKK